MLPQVGEKGQIRLKESSILVVGAGGLGSPVLLYLASAGIGRIGIIDDDIVDISNLQRQIIHSSISIGDSKVDSASNRLKELNPENIIETYDYRLNVDNALEIISKFDLVVDGTDNFETRYIINDACEILNKTWVFGSIHRFDGQVSVFNHRGGPNYRDLFPQAPPPELAPNCAEAGVLGVLPGLVGSIQANEALKIILDIGEPLSGKLLTIDALSMQIRSLSFIKDPKRQKITELSEEAISCAVTGNQDGEGSANFEFRYENILPTEFKSRTSAGWKPFFLDVRTEIEERIVSLPNTSLRISIEKIPSNIELIPRDRDIVVYCKSGKRSINVVQFLEQSGLKGDNLYNLVGGIHLWSDTVDSSVIKYGSA
jgi:adenylyltransferase/sulfurtransferase